MFLWKPEREKFFRCYVFVFVELMTMMIIFFCFDFHYFDYCLTDSISIFGFFQIIQIIAIPLKPLPLENENKTDENGCIC